MNPHEELAKLLRHRQTVIADHAWRDRDPVQHLEALKQVSTAIEGWTGRQKGRIDPKLAHYLTNASYAKALAHVEAMG